MCIDAAVRPVSVEPRDHTGCRPGHERPAWRARDRWVCADSQRCSL